MHFAVIPGIPPATTILPDETTLPRLESRLTINDQAYNSTQTFSLRLTKHNMQTRSRECTVLVLWPSFRAARVGVGCSMNLEVISIISLSFA